MRAPTSSYQNNAFAKFVLLALAACTIAALATEKNATAQRRLATTLADAPSLRLLFTVKRSSMNLYGQSQFYVFANPVVSSDNTSVIYDGYARLTDGTGEYTYILANGIAYVVTSTVGSTSDSIADCLDSTLLPPFNDIISALNNATAVSNAVVGNDTITCASGIMFQVTLSDATFVICSSGSNGFTAYGSDMDITVDYLNSPVTITPPSLNPDVALSCETVITPISVSDTALALLTGQEIPLSK